VPRLCCEQCPYVLHLQQGQSLHRFHKRYLEESDLQAYMQRMHVRADLSYLRYPAHGMQIYGWRMGQASQMSNAHAFNAPSIVAACSKTKRKLQISRQQSQRNAADRVCYDCDRKRCNPCNKEKGYKDFSHAVWDLDVGSPELLCAHCVAGQRKYRFWKCANKRCRTAKPHSEFSMAIAKHGQGVHSHSKQCDACLQRHEEEVPEMTLARACAEEAQAIVRERPSPATFKTTIHLKHACSFQCKWLSQSISDTSA
jgi:hypothetical protein